MENDVNTDQVVTDNADANTDQVVIGQDVNAEPVQQQADDSANQEQTVPYDRFKEVNDAKKAAEEQAAYAQRQLELMQMNAQQQQTQYVAPKTTADQALEELGLTADDLFGDNIIKYQAKKDELDALNAQKAQVAMTTQQFAISHPDIQEVVGSVNLTTGQIIAPTAELLALVQKRPSLAQASTSEIYNEVLRERKFQEYERNAAVNNEHLNRQGVKVATQPLGGSAAGGGTTGSQGSQQMMTREQVLDIQRRLAAGEIIS